MAEFRNYETEAEFGSRYVEVITSIIQYHSREHISFADEIAISRIVFQQLGVSYDSLKNYTINEIVLISNELERLNKQHGTT